VAVVNHRPERLALLALLALLPFQAVSAQSGAQTAPAAKDKELRPGSLDVILLLDKSLSMAPFFEEAKAYAAGTVLGPVLIPGDRLIVETVYGKVDRLVTATIASEADKAKAIRAIRAVKADGHFTDLGAALDAAKRDLDELGQPERPKYVLLVTDERQEAPKGSPYQAPDHKLKHPSLEYVKRVDLGKFRAITVGLQVGTKVTAATPVVMQLLMDPPVRDAMGGPGAAGSITKASASGGTSAAGAKGAVGGGATPSEKALPAWLLYGAAVVLIVALAGLAVVFFAYKRKEKEKNPTT
jgi:flagellar basal body-associated protein FliL